MGLALLSAVAIIAIVALVLFLNTQMTGNVVGGGFGVYSANYVASPNAYAQRTYGPLSVNYYQRTQDAGAKSAVTERSAPSSRNLQTTY